MYAVKPFIKKKIKEEDRRRKVLAIVGDTQVGLWVVRNLAMNGLTVHSIVKSKYGQPANSRYSSSAWVMESPAYSPGFIDEIKELVKLLDVGSIMPVAEGYHNVLIDVRDQFEPDVHIFSPARDVFDKATDKDYMQGLCQELGVPVAKGMRLDEFMLDKGSLEFPLVFRTRRQNIQGGQAPWKAAYAEDEVQLEKVYDQVRDFADNIIVQEYCPGAEDHVQVMMYKGEPFMVGDYIGEHHMPLAGGVTTQRISCRHQPLIDDAVKLFKAIGYEGLGGVQYHYDPETDKYIFLEINPRFIGGTPTLIMAGFNTSFLLWQSHFEPEKMKKTKYRLGLRSRILGGDANWMIGMIRGDQLPPGQKRLGKVETVLRFLWNCFPWTKDDAFMLRDPKPFMVDFMQMAKKLGAQGHDIIGNPESQDAKH
ncbi:ATP-grasp domain-containing protein [Desulfobacter latus]|uniref:ATP-grasp domain-containing protein n=1 Tax=Desulfobacter latus TaxID=2292 RepID=A0A850T021_9BACT|nr:ATP-grasp domain-containing protein [Desulfobacter latus]NWH05043.1 ATP-grasp domain-containing protein [Desulfobacter latus]